MNHVMWITPAKLLLLVIAAIPVGYIGWLIWAVFRYPVPVSYNWRSIWQRKVSTLSTVSAVAIVVMIFVVVLSMAQGVSKAYIKSGRDDQVVVLRPNARVEMMSVITRDQARLLQTHPLVLWDELGPLATNDTVISKQVPMADGSGSMSISVRGTTFAGVRMRNQVRLLQGRWFLRGLSEVAVPSRMVGRYLSLDLGQRFDMGGRTWTVVGVFDGGGSAFDSEIWTDAEDLMQAFRRWSAYSSVTVRLRSAESADRFITDVEKDVRLKLEAKTEPVYFASLNDAGQPMQVLGYIITVILTVGAVFAAMNTMYAAVAGRTSEIGTLRAIGYRRSEILASFQWEAILLTALGGLIGSCLSMAFNGMRSGAVSMSTWSDMSFAFSVTPTLMAQGVGFSVLMGLIGGFLPAWRASRIPVTEAMRS